MNYSALSIADLKAIHDLANEMWAKKSLTQEQRERWADIGARALEELKTRLLS